MSVGEAHPSPHAPKRVRADREPCPEEYITRAQRRRHTVAPLDPDLDWVAVEEPLEIRVNGYPLSVVMRTPGHDEELVTGYIVSESIARAEHVRRVRHCDVEEETENVMQVTLAEESDFDPLRFSRHLYVTSSCGVCGKRSISQALSTAPPLEARPSFDSDALKRGVEMMRQKQPGYRDCGGLHGAGLLDAQGELVVVREDVGRHNAVDKALGWAIRHSVALDEYALLISGRASFEMVQKALAARIGTVVAVGGVSSLAIALAERAHVNLLGFASKDRVNVYRGIEGD